MGMRARGRSCGGGARALEVPPEIRDLVEIALHDGSLADNYDDVNIKYAFLEKKTFP